MIVPSIGTTGAIIVPEIATNGTSRTKLSGQRPSSVECKREVRQWRAPFGRGLNQIASDDGTVGLAHGRQPRYAADLH
ncbi:MAG: hypothetical protein KGJ57_21150 [Sphingomonadales bacterium]|nr:hypothetical protein [Sphingomonadales bacterium]MDE2171904.1 hypothetical protein [Sphingomonadales bacterium]